jgi:hypothetical protein
MSDAARAWLATNADDVPAQLQHRMEEAASVVASGPAVAVELAAAAVDCLRVAFQHCDDRAAALHLLAADALLTHACALAAETGSDALDHVSRDLTPARLHALIARQRA